MKLEDINKSLWNIAGEIPELREALIAEADLSAGLYSIPTLQYSELTGEVEDGHITLLENVDEAQKDKLTQIIKQIDNMTVGQLSKALACVRTAILINEAETGAPAEGADKTLKDLDLTGLAFHIMLYYGEYFSK